MKHRRHDVGRDLLDPPAQPVTDFGNRHFVRKRGHDQLLQGAQLPALANVGQQRKDIAELPLAVADGLDVRGHPDFVAVLVVDEELFLGPVLFVERASQLSQRLAIGVAADQQVACPASFRFIGSVTEQVLESGVGVDGLQLAIRHDDAAVAAIGELLEQRQPVALLDLARDIAHEQDMAVFIARRQRPKPQCGANPAAVLAPDRHLGKLGALCGRRLRHPRKLLLQLFGADPAGVTADQLRAGHAKDRCGSGIDVAHDKIAVENQDAIAGAVERRLEDIRRQGPRVTACTHRQILNRLSNHQSRPGSKRRGRGCGSLAPERCSKGCLDRSNPAKRRHR